MGILDIFSKTKPAYNLLVLSIFLILVCLPRFNRNPLLIKRDLNDAAFYIAYVEYFRGEKPSAPLLPAFNWRPGVPFVASFLPFDPMTSINIVNVICLLISLLVLDKILASVKASIKQRLIGSILFVFSFPAFYYSTVGYLDAGAVLICTLGLYFTLKNNYFALVPVLLAGAVVKESTVIIVPAAVIFAYATFGPRRTILLSLLCITAFLFAFYGIRQIAPNTVPFHYTGTWPIFFSTFPENISRPNTYISFLLTLGLPFLLTAYLIKHYKLSGWLRKNIIALCCCISILTATGLYIFAFFRAAADGRVIWAAYPYLILLSILAIQRSEEIFTSRKQTNSSFLQKILFAK